MANDQQFCLRWNNHQTTLVEIFDKLLSNDSLVDCTLAAEGQYMRAHKVLLSACSPYFELILSQHNDKHPIIILKDVTFRELKALMDYMYRGEVNVSQDQLAALLKVAENLQIKGLSDSGGGGTEPKEKPPEKRPLPPPPPAQQPTPIIPRPGLTIEHRRSNQLDLSQHSPSALDGSPVPRKRKRTRRRSSDDESSLGHTPIESHHDSSSRESSSLSIPPNVASTPLSKSVAVIPEPPPVLDRTDHILPEPAQPIHQDIVHKTEPNTEMLLEPKHEYPDDDMNEDSVEDLTLEDDMNDLDQSQAGPSGEGSSSQGFTPWHMATDRSTDEVFMQAQEAVGAQRDSQDNRGEKLWLYEEDLGMKPEGSEPDQFEATDYNVMDCKTEESEPAHVEPARFASVPEGTASDSLTPKVSEQSTIHIVQPSLVLGLHTQDESEPTHVEPAGSALVLEGTARDSLTPKVSEQSTIHIVQPSLMIGQHTQNEYLHLVHRNVASLNFKSKNGVYSKSPVSTKIQFRKIAPKPSSSNIDAPVDAVKAPNTTSTSLNLVKTINKSDSLRTNLLKAPAKEKIIVARKLVFHKKLVNDNVRHCTKTTRSTSSNSKSNIQSDDECNAQSSPMRLRSNKRKLANTLSMPSTTSSAATISKSNIAPGPILPVPVDPSVTWVRPFLCLKCFRCFKHFSSHKSLHQHLHYHFT